MHRDAIHERGWELEQTYFLRRDHELAARLAAQRKRRLDIEQLRSRTGIASEALIGRLLDLKFGPTTLPAFGLVPAVEVAWADGRIDNKEKRAVLAAAKASGVSPAGLEIIKRWLVDRPPRALFDTWSAYTSTLVKHLSAAARLKMKNDVLDGALSVARASGGFFGISHKVSRAERGVIKKIAQAFD